MKRTKTKTTRKRAVRKAPAPSPTMRSMSRGDAYYIEQHFGTHAVEAMAQDLELGMAEVQAYVDKLTEAGVEPPKKKQTRLETAGYDRAGLKKGVTVATQSSSMLADEMAGHSPFVDRKPSKKGRRESPDIIRYKV